MSFEDHGCFGIFIAFVICQLYCACAKIGGERYAKYIKLKCFDLIALTSEDALVHAIVFEQGHCRYIFLYLRIEHICICEIGIDERIMDLE